MGGGLLAVLYFVYGGVGNEERFVVGKSVDTNSGTSSTAGANLLKSSSGSSSGASSSASSSASSGAGSSLTNNGLTSNASDLLVKL